MAGEGRDLNPVRGRPLAAKAAGSLDAFILPGHRLEDAL
jgi:hypothetical protein